MSCIIYMYRTFIYSELCTILLVWAYKDSLLCSLSWTVELTCYGHDGFDLAVPVVVYEQRAHVVWGGGNLLLLSSLDSIQVLCQLLITEPKAGEGSVHSALKVISDCCPVKCFIK